MGVDSGPILHVVQHLRPGGLEVMALELARAESARHPAQVLSLEGSLVDALAHWPRLAAQQQDLLFAGKRPGLDPLLPLRLIGMFRRIRPVCVHTHHIGPLLYAGSAARLAGVRTRIHTEHDAWHLKDPRRRKVAKLALALANPVLVADAPNVADAVAEALGGPAPRTILNGVATDRFTPGDKAAARAALGLPQDAQVIGVAARLEEVKGVDIAIRAHAALRRPTVLAIAGAGTQDAALRQLAQTAGAGDRVIFLGLQDDMTRFYQAIDLLCLSSRAEGLPLSLLEAQSSGVPVVASRVGGVAAAVCPVSGRLVDSQDVAGFSAAFDAALQSSGPDAARAARDFVLRCGSLAAAAQAYLALSLG